MLHSRLFSEDLKYRKKCFDSSPVAPATTAPTQLDGSSLDRPLFVQFCANDPDVLLDAARHVESHCDAVDLNLGCPQGIAKKGRYGSFLQDEWELISNMISTLHRELTVPVTAKIRILESKERTLEYAKMILSAGASIIAVHGRTREQKGHYTGLADWSYIRYLRENLPPETVIFANGNILEHGDIQRCLEATGADGVMSAEGCLSNPSIFSAPPSLGADAPGYWRGRDGKGGYRLDAVMRRYLDIIKTHVDTSSGLASGRPNSPSLVGLRAHLFDLLRLFLTKHTDIREALARAKPNMTSLENIHSMVEARIQEALVEYEKGEGANESQVGDAKKTKLPWWVCQSFVRDLPSEALKKGSIKLPKNESKRSAMLSNIAEQARKANENGTLPSGTEIPEQLTAVT
jgi:tRNA-dihydrouridine synthase 1